MTQNCVTATHCCVNKKFKCEAVPTRLWARRPCRICIIRGRLFYRRPQRISDRALYQRDLARRKDEGSFVDRRRFNRGNPQNLVRGYVLTPEQRERHRLACSRFLLSDEERERRKFALYRKRHPRSLEEYRAHLAANKLSDEERKRRKKVWRQSPEGMRYHREKQREYKGSVPLEEYRARIRAEKIAREAAEQERRSQRAARKALEPKLSPEERKLRAAEKGRQWRAANPDRNRELIRNWKALNKERVRAEKRLSRLKRRLSLEPLVAIPCKICGTIFQRRNRNASQVTCGLACSEINRVEKNREHSRRNAKQSFKKMREISLAMKALEQLGVSIPGKHFFERVKLTEAALSQLGITFDQPEESNAR